MAKVREHLSPDGLLRFRVVVGDDGDVSLGFDGYAWHTHADVLSATSGLPQPEAVERYVRDLLEDRAVVALSRVGGAVAEAWVTDCPESESRHASPGEVVDLRYWSGRPWGGP
jgi:hypothetical protein